jgi:serine protease inhibitor
MSPLTLAAPILALAATIALTPAAVAQRGASRPTVSGTVRDHLMRAEAAAGTIDSVAVGHLKAAPPDAAPFGTFGQRFFAEALRRASADSNAILSPPSAALALSMVLTGARGETADRMARALDPDADVPDPAGRSGALLAAARDRKDVTLQIASAVWVDTMLALQTGFQRTLASSYGAVARSVPLGSPRGLAAINRWADSATRGKIASLLNEPLPDSGLFVANAVHFKGKWLKPFDTRETRQRDFTLHSGRRVRVATMERTGAYGYRRAPGYQIVRLPYRGGRTSMYIVLPDSGVTIAALVDSLTDQGWPASLARADFRTVHILLPRFKVEQTISLEPVLKAVGFGIAFDVGRADLRGIAQWKRDGRPAELYISRALQKVFVEVDEEGTEAAAVTGILVTAKEVPPPPVQFVVDRPFLFLLRDEVSGADMFVGSVARPR